MIRFTGLAYSSAEDIRSRVWVFASHYTTKDATRNAIIRALEPMVSAYELSYLNVDFYRLDDSDTMRETAYQLAGDICGRGREEDIPVIDITLEPERSELSRLCDFVPRKTATKILEFASFEDALHFAQNLARVRG